MAARAKPRSGGDAFAPPLSHLQLFVEACEPALSTPCDTLEHKDTTSASNILDNWFGIQSVQEEMFVSILEERGRAIWAQHGCMWRHTLKPGGNTHTPTAGHLWWDHSGRTLKPGGNRASDKVRWSILCLSRLFFNDRINLGGHLRGFSSRTSRTCW